MADLIDLSSRIIDEGAEQAPGMLNRVTRELSEVADGVAVVEAFSHVVSFRTDDGLVLFDTSLQAHAPAIIKALRGWSKDPVHSIAFTHGHVDHIGGTQAFLDEAADSGNPRPRIIGHENVGPRIDRYIRTGGYNGHINARQFGANRPGGGKVADAKDGPPPFGPRTWVKPDTTFESRMNIRVGDEHIELFHDKGETDDHPWP